MTIIFYCEKYGLHYIVLKTKRKKKKGKHRWCLSCGIVSLSSCVCSFFLPPPPPTLPPPGVNRAVFSPGKARSPGEQVGSLPAPPLLSHFVGDVSFAPLGLLTLLTCQPLGRASDQSTGQPRQSRARAPLAHSLRGTEGIWGWCPPCVTNPPPQCLAPSVRPLKQCGLGTGQRGWAVAISLASPSTYTPHAPGAWGDLPCPRMLSVYQVLTGHFPIHSISWEPRHCL